MNSLDKLSNRQTTPCEKKNLNIVWCPANYIYHMLWLDISLMFEGVKILLKFFNLSV